MTMEMMMPPERLVKSAERVRDLGEVFTPASTVKEMLDLLPGKVWTPHPSLTFLEPACGDGNFLIAILDRKLKRIARDLKQDKLAAGTTTEAVQFHALEALASIYAVDISADNIIGGTPGHEVGARSRLLVHFVEWNKSVLGKTLNERSLALRAAAWIVEHNLIVGNMLPIDSSGKPSGRDDIPIIEYCWSPETLWVSLSKTTLGDVITAQEAEVGEVLSLFTAGEPEEFWQGKALSLNNAERVVAPKLRCAARNGSERRI